MKKKKCCKCIQKKGTRLCRLHDNEFICPLCCAKDRSSSGCEGCRYYAEAKRYAATKPKKSAEKHFIAEINEEVERTVDQALAQVERGAIKEGETILSELKKKHPRNHTIFFGLGVVHAFKEQYEEAIEYFDKAIDIFPYYIDAHFNKGVACQKKLDIKNMITSFNEVVALGNPNDDIVRQAKTFISSIEQAALKASGIDLETYLKCQEEFNQAFSCMERQEWQKAIDGFKVCLSKNKNHPQSYGNIGLCYARLGRKDLALAAFNMALKIDPAYEPALINKNAVESLNEGEILNEPNYQSVDYYKDYPMKKKSLAKSIIQKITGHR